MESKHTPGPWRIDFYSPSKEGEGRMIYIASNRRPLNSSVALIGNEMHEDEDHPHTADARLIAAAPDLLKALKGVMRYCVTPQGMPDKDKGRTKEQHDAYAAAVAAIAKAEGRDAAK